MTAQSFDTLPLAAADNVQRVLPQTGLCTTAFSVDGGELGEGCGGPAPAKADGCCVTGALGKNGDKKGSYCRVAT